MNIAVINSSADSTAIGGFQDSGVLSLRVSEPGLYLVFARVVLQNSDPSSQNATAQVSREGGVFIIDRADVFLPGHARYSISLQGTLQVVPGSPQFVDLSC